MIMDVQTELIFFALAIATHLLFFSKLGANAKKLKVGDGATKKQQFKAAPSGSLAGFKAAIRASDLKSALSHFETLKGLWDQSEESPSSAPQVLMEQLVKLAGQSGALGDLLQLVTTGKGLDLILNECAQQKDATTFKEAERLGREHHVKFTAATYQALIKAAGACGRLADAKRFMQEAQDAGIVDIATHTTYTKELLTKGATSQEVRKAVESLKNSGLQLNCSAFNGLLSVAVANNANIAWSMFDEAEAFHVTPDHITCSILAKCIEKSTAPSAKGNLDRLMATVDGLSGDADEVLLGSVVEACLKVGRVDVLMPFLKKQRASGGFAVKAAHTYGSIIRAYGYVHDVESAWTVWNEMRRQHIVPLSVTCGCMVEALVTNGDLEGGYELIQQLRQDDKTTHLVNAIIYGSVVKGFSQKRCFERVWEVYDEMLAQKLQFSMVTFNTLIDACSRSGDLARIPSLLNDIREQGLKLGIITYSTILKGYCQVNRLDDAFELVETMQRTTELQPDEVMFNTLLDGCARRGLFDRGMQTYKMMQAAGVRPSNFTLSVIVKLANRGKKLEEAFRLCDEITSANGFRLNVHVFDNLVQACINHHDVPRAIGVVERMLTERVRPDLRTYSLLLKACMDARKFSDAAGLLRAGTGLAEAHPSLAAASGAAQPQGGLPGDLVSEILQGLITAREERLATSLLVDLGRSLPKLRLDPKLRLWLGARVGDFKEQKSTAPWRK